MLATSAKYPLLVPPPQSLSRVVPVLSVTIAQLDLDSLFLALQETHAQVLQ